MLIRSRGNREEVASSQRYIFRTVELADFIWIHYQIPGMFGINGIVVTWRMRDK